MAESELLTTERVEPGPAGCASDSAASEPSRGVRRRLTNHNARSATTIQGLPSIVFGGVFAVVGAFIVLVGLRVIPSDDSSFHVPPPMVAACGLLFLLPGLMLMVHGLRGIIRNRRYAAHAARNPDSPWVYEYAWDRDGERRSSWKGVLLHVKGVLMFGGFLVPFNWIAFGVDDFPTVMRWGIGLFDLIAVLLVCGVIYKTVQALRYGSSYVRFGTFPYFTGSRMDLRFGLESANVTFRSVRVVLRAVEEAYEVHGTGKNRSERVVAYAVHEEERIFDDPLDMPRPGSDLALTFRLPADAPGTDLNARPPVYWELEVSGDAPGIDFGDTFLIPVYSRR